MEQRAERLGVLGGTFDPPHRGHLELARAALAFPLDRVLVVVAGDPWQKRNDVVAPAADRLAMAEALVEGAEGIEVSDAELRRPGPTYTADTLEAMAEPGRELFLVLGEDAAAGLPTWHRPEAVRELAVLLVAQRGGDEMGDDVVERLRQDGWRCHPLPMPEVPVSSSEVRERLDAGEPLGDLVPPGVIHLIEERRLYTRFA